MDRRMQKTKTAIQNAYFSLLTEKDPARITVSEIARRADIDRKTFYLHYETAEDVVEEFAEDKIRELLSMLERDDFFSQPVDLHLLFACLSELIMRDLKLYQQLARASAFDFVWTKMEEALVSAIKDVFAEKVALSEEEWDVYARFYASGVISIYAAWLRGELPFDIDRLGEIAADVTFFGAEKILSREG